jgi:RimJ/RimL family protein N-acetyltransferase
MCQAGTNGAPQLWSIDVNTGVPCIGQIALIPRQDPSDLALSFWLAPSYWGKGLASEAVHALLGVAFSENLVQQVWAGAALWNLPSTTLLKNLGFVQTGNNPCGYLIDGTAQPTAEFILSKGVWLNQIHPAA